MEPAKGLDMTKLESKQQEMRERQSWKPKPNTAGFQNPRAGFIYFIATVDRQFVKIGWSISPRSRLPDLQTACPYELILLGRHAGTQQDETALHCQFAARRVRRNGEWFHLAPELTEYITTMTIQSELWTV